MDTYQSYISKSRYARYNNEEERRETWEETVNRYFSFFSDRLKKSGKTGTVISKLYECRDAVRDLDVMPSMRCLMTAGKALDRDNVACFNCSYLPIDHPHCFDEILYILTCGVGCGFSVESDDVAKLPEIPCELYPTDTVIVVPDSKIGWATSLRELVSMLYAGKVPKWDVSRVRPAGSKLKTFGGRASGPEPLVELFKFVISVFNKATGRRLRPIECHDIVCKIADIVVVGGVRRSALISLSDLSDGEMRDCKSGRWWETNTQRALANNSAVFNTKPDLSTFMDEWMALYRSGSGERGIFNRGSCKRYVSRIGRRDPNFKFGGNPCLEIVLRPFQFCNLTSVQLSPSETPASACKKVQLATILGTLQSSLTDFRYLRKIWKKNSEEERLLGVSLSGICDSSFFSNPGPELNKVLVAMKELAIETNREWAEILGINPSTAITCVKPEGTTSQLCDRSSGIHPRYSQYYLRTVRADKKDPLAIYMKDLGFPCEDDVTKPGSTLVFGFPIKSPEGSKLRDDMTALDQLELWLCYKEHWAEHTVSCTVYVRENEWLKVADWVYEHFDEISGLSFLPFSDHVYKQAPYSEINQEEYEKLLADLPKEIDWVKLSEYEKQDQTTGSQEYACQGGSCELV